MELPWVLLALAGTGAATGLALLPYVPRVPPAALPGKLTATTFALERPCCIFDRHANASDTVWLAVAFANASATFRNPPSRADVPLYESLPTTHSYMTLETAAAAYACSAPSPAILRVGGDTACGGQGGRDPCNGPLPSPGPYRVKFLVMGCHGPKAETRWSDPILLRREKLPYTPTLAHTPLGGLTTTSTFVLEQPRCVFTKLQDNAVIWLVVAVPKAVENFNNSVGPGTPERAFQGFPGSADAYMTLNTTILNYPCPKPPGEITVLRVGSETGCIKDETRPTCNGPLPGPGPYRVKFLALNGSEPVAETAWSQPITLRTARPLSSIPAMGSGHSAGMIALTTILSILFAILLAGLVAMLVFWGSDAYGGSSTFSKPEAVTVRRYNTHHAYDQPAARL
ncbi:uroplakin-3b-like protein 1 isoform 2-T2 [Theristicus caerulescens]